MAHQNNMMTHEEQKKATLQSMERQRFGYTRDEILAVKGNICGICGQPVPDSEIVIDHKDGGGRHHTERGLIVSGKTHNMDNLQVAHRSCAGRKDAVRGSMGLGIEGNPNNKA